MSIKKFNKNKQISLSHQIIKAGRLINSHGLRSAREKLKTPGLKQVHLDLFPFIDFEGTSVSDIAQRKAVSKQAISKLVAEMIEMKILYTKENPKDSRSKLVCFYQQGPRSIEKGFKALMDIDQALKKQLGKHQYEATLRSLNKIIEKL